MDKSGVHTTSMICLQLNLITMALITGQTVIFSWIFFPEKQTTRNVNLDHGPLNYADLLLFLRYTKAWPTPGPLLTLFPLPGPLLS